MPRHHPPLDWPRSPDDVHATASPSWSRRHKVLTSLGLLALLILLIGTRLNVPEGPATAGMAAPDPEPAVVAADPSAAPRPRLAPRRPAPAAVRAHAQARADAAARAEAEAAIGNPAMPQVGDPVTDERLEFTVTKIECGLSQIGGDWLNVVPEGQFCLVRIQVENVGDRPQAFYGDHQVLVTTKGHRYAPSADAASYLDHSRSLREPLDPGDVLTGRVVYDLPKRSTPDRIDLHASLYSPGVAVVLS